MIKKYPTKEYLEYQIAFFPNKNNKQNEEIMDDENENDIKIDWEFSSPQISEDEQSFKDKSDIKSNDNKKINLEKSLADEDVIPIVKY